MKTITDGSAIFVVRDKRIQAMVDMLYPVGSVYISADKNKTKADFPFMQYGTWEEIPANLCLQTVAASEAGTQRSEGLPNITGSFKVCGMSTGGIDLHGGAFWNGGVTYGDVCVVNHGGYPNGYADSGNGSFDASRSNPIYGASTTVQPPAYMVRAWVRTA